MAINKNFVIKNGIQVNDNLFVADPDNNKIGINTALPDYELHVNGGIGATHALISGVTTSIGDLLVGADGGAFAVKVSAGNSVGIGTSMPSYPLEVRGPASIGQIAEYVYGDLEVTGDIASANFSSGGASFTGITTFTNGTDNTIGVSTSGAVQVRGGLGVSKNVTVGGGLSVTGSSYFVGVVTFAAGASGKIQLGDNANDNVEFQADVNSNIIPNDTSTFDLGTSSQEWRDLHLAGNAGIGSLAVTGISTFSDNVEISSLTENRIPIVGAGSTIEDDANLTFDGSRLAVGVALTVSGISTFSGNIDADGDLDVDGHTELDDLNVSGVSTFASNLDINASVDISDDLVINDALNVVGLSTFGSDVDINADVDVSGNAGIGSLSVTGISTFTGNIDADGDLDVDGHTDLDDLVVSGVSTFSANIDADANVDIAGNLDVDGHTELDDVNVSAASTFGGLVDINAGAQANTLKVEDLTDDRIVIAGTGGELEDSANLTFDGTTLAVTGDQTVSGTIDIDGQAIFDDITVSSASTFTGDIDANGNLDVDGRTELDITNISETLNVTGITTFESDVNVGGGLSVTGNSYFVGMVTFAGGTNGNIVLGDTATDNVVFNADVDSNVIPNTDGTYDLGSSTQEWKDLYVDGVAYIDTLQVHDSVVGVVTFADIDVDGHTDLDDLVVAGVSTFSANIDADGNVDIAGNLDVDGHTELDDLNVTGVSTFTSTVNVKNLTGPDAIKVFGTEDSEVFVHANGDRIGDFNSDSGPQNDEVFSLVIGGNAADVEVASSRLKVKRTGGNITAAFKTFTTVVGVTYTVSCDVEGIFSTGNPRVQVTDATDGGTAYTGTQLGVANGNFNTRTSISFTFTATSTSSSLNLGISDYTREFYVYDLSITAPLEATKITMASNGNVNVSGITTLSSLDVSGNVDIDGYAELDDVNVSGITTLSTLNIGNTIGITSIVDEDNMASDSATALPTQQSVKAYVDTQVTAQDLDFAGNSGTGSVDLDSQSLTIFGTANEIETVGSGQSITVGLPNDVTITGELDVTTLDVSGNADIDGYTELDDVNVSGATTTQTLHVGTGGTTLTVDAENATFAIGSATTTVTATMNGGAIPSIGLVIALGS